MPFDIPVSNRISCLSSINHWGVKPVPRIYWWTFGINSQILKGSYLFHCCGSRPIFNPFEFYWVHWNLSFFNDHLIQVFLNSHFLGLRLRSFSCKCCRTFLSNCSSTSSVPVKFMMSSIYITNPFSIMSSNVVSIIDWNVASELHICQRTLHRYLHTLTNSISTPH